MKIAVITPSRPHFGNTLTQLPFLSALKKQYGECEITLWTKFDTSKILLVNNGADHVINYHKWSSVKLLKRFNAEHYDVVYNLRSGSGRVHLLIGLFSNAKVKYGLSDASIFKHYYDKFLCLKKGTMYIANTHLKLLELVTRKKYTTDIITSVLTDNKQANYVHNILALLPGGGAGAFKRWPLDNYIKCAEEISIASKTTIKRIVFILGPDEHSYETQIPKMINEIKVEIAHSPSVASLIELALNTKLAIANDCGPAHIFQMMKTPMISLWGWKNEDSPPYDTMKEWFLSYENAWAVTPNDEDKSIQAISRKKITTVALAQLNRL
jgi:ADP-heptose:LPS heptosyltransferase